MPTTGWWMAAARLRVIWRSESPSSFEHENDDENEYVRICTKVHGDWSEWVLSPDQEVNQLSPPAIQLIQLHTVWDELEGECLRSALDAVGIDTYRTMNEGMGVLWRSVTVDIVVRSDQLVEARDFLHELGIVPSAVSPKDSAAHIAAVREAFAGRFLRHPWIKWYVVLALVYWAGMIAGTLVSELMDLLAGR